MNMNWDMNKNIKYNSLDEYGKYIEAEYSNVRFVFEIHYTRDDYTFLKEHFFDETDFNQTQFSSDYFQVYFKNHPTHRLLFLMMLTGFIRYEYLNDENGSNFFSNFLKNCLYNETTNIQTFRNNLINYFFKFMGNRQFETQGLYLYGTQTDKVSLKLEEAGHNKFLNSFILHAGGISERDLNEYMKIIKCISEKDSVITFSNHELYAISESCSHYNNRLKKFFKFLLSEGEVSGFVKYIIMKSIDFYHGFNLTASLDNDFSFELPRFIKNYLLFIGKYGDELEKYNINTSNVYYENQNLILAPSHSQVFSKMQNISFHINGKIYPVNKSRDLFVKDDFINFKIVLENIEQTQQVDLYVDGHLYKKYEFNLFKHSFVLFNPVFSVKNILRDTIEVPVSDEDNYLYMLTREILDHIVEDEFEIKHKDYYLYKVKTDRSLSKLNIGNKQYAMHYQPKFTIEYDYKNDEGYEYFGVIPEFSALSEGDTSNFVALDLLNNVELTYEEYLQYPDVIGKFDISIGINNFKVIYIDGFEIKEWFQWHDSDKTIEISVASDKVKTNSIEEFFNDNKTTHIFDIDTEEKDLFFNTIEGKQVILRIAKPSMKFTFIDKRKQKYTIKSKNIHLDTLSNYKKLTIELLNFPNSIKFTKLDVNGKEINTNKIENKYYISLKELKEVCTEGPASYYALKLVGNGNYYLPILNIIDPTMTNDTELRQFGVRDVVKITSVDFIKETIGEIKYYIKNKGKMKPFFAMNVEYDSTYDLEMIKFVEARETKKETAIIKPHKTILEEGMYVDKKDLDWYENIA